MTYEAIIDDLKQKKYKPVYLLHGEEPYHIDLITDYIAENVLTEAEKSFNQTTLYGKDSDAAQVINAAKRFPMMASHQVIILKEGQELKDFKELEHYLKQPLQSTLLVINYKYKKLDSRTKLFKQFQEKGVVFESKKLYDNQVPGWITGYLSQKAYSIDPKAAFLLSEFLGSDLSKIANELEKLIIILGEKTRKITPELVERNIGISKDYNQFELQKALGQKDVVKANRIINYFAENQKNHHITQTISTLYFYFSKLLIYYYLKDRSKQNVAAALKINPYFVSDYAEAARRYKATKVAQIISILREYDMRSKGYNGDTTAEGELLKEMVFKILH